MLQPLEMCICWVMPMNFSNNARACSVCLRSGQKYSTKLHMISYYIMKVVLSGWLRVKILLSFHIKWNNLMNVECVLTIEQIQITAIQLLLLSMIMFNMELNCCCRAIYKVQSNILIVVCVNLATIPIDYILYGTGIQAELKIWQICRSIIIFVGWRIVIYDLFDLRTINNNNNRFNRILKYWNDGILRFFCAIQNWNWNLKTGILFGDILSGWNIILFLYLIYLDSLFAHSIAVCLVPCVLSTKVIAIRNLRKSN